MDGGGELGGRPKAVVDGDRDSIEIAGDFGAERSLFLAGAEDETAAVEVDQNWVVRRSGGHM